MKTLITLKFKEEEFQSLKDLGYDVIYRNEKDIVFSDEIKDIDTMVCFNPFNKIDIDMFPNLKWIQLLSAGINQVPIDKVLNNDIKLTNNRGGYSIPIAEWTVLKILEMFKNSKEFHNKQREKIWESDSSLLELYGKTVGFLGTGSIAKETAKRLEAFGVNILGFNTDGKDRKHFHKSYNIEKLKDMVPELDILVVAAPYTDETHHLVDRSVLSNMKNDSYIVNIARGSIIDEKALIESLKSGNVKKAALDVFEEEPLPKDSPLWTMDNVYVSPHTSWASEMIKRRRYEISYENMKRYISNEDLVNVVDIHKGY